MRQVGPLHNWRDDDQTALVATDSEWSTIANALRAGACYFSQNAKLAEGHDDVIAEGYRQAAESARALADKIAEETGV